MWCASATAPGGQLATSAEAKTGVSIAKLYSCSSCWLSRAVDGQMASEGVRRLGLGGEGEGKGEGEGEIRDSARGLPTILNSIFRT